MCVSVFACVGGSGFIYFVVSKNSSFVILFCSVKTGAVFEDDKFFNESTQMLQYAVDEANDKILQDSGMRLAIESEIIAYGREYAVSKRVCNLLEVNKNISHKKNNKHAYTVISKQVNKN